MKKNFVSSGLLLLIIVLVGVAAAYYYFNKESFENNSTPEIKEEEKPNNKPVQSNLVKKITTLEEFQSYSNSGNNVFFVLGRSGCHFCEMYLPVLNSVSSEYSIEIVYVDFSKLSNEDYKSVMNSGLTIPSKCTTSGEETPLSSGFGTPLSLFVNGNKSYDCIRGYKDKDNLIEQLKSIGYIE